MSDRPLDLTDLIPRFDGASSQGHLRDARSLVERLGDDGRRLLKDKPDAAERWVSGCQEMKKHIISYGARPADELATDMREFIHMFEHHMERMLQMMLGLAKKSPGDEALQLRVRQIQRVDEPDVPLCNLRDLGAPHSRQANSQRPAHIHQSQHRRTSN